MPVETVEEYFYRIGKKNGIISFIYDLRCKTKEQVDSYIEYLIEIHK